MGNSFASIFGGLVAYGIGEIQMPAIAHWRVLFLILGSITTVYALILYLFLPDSPDKAVFLDAKQQQIALRRTIENRTGFKDNDEFVPSQVIDALTDPQTWPLILYTISVSLANGGLTSVSAYPPALFFQSSTMLFSDPFDMPFILSSGTHLWSCAHAQQSLGTGNADDRSSLKPSSLKDSDFQT